VAPDRTVLWADQPGTRDLGSDQSSFFFTARLAAASAIARAGNVVNLNRFRKKKLREDKAPEPSSE
jgi:hypothetical protein